MLPSCHSCPVSLRARLYAALHQGTEGDVDFYVETCRAAKRVVELGCGYGRLLGPLAAPGRTLIGVDDDAEMLELAQQTIAGLSPDEREGIELVEADMLIYEPDAPVDAVIIPHSGIYCLLEPEQVLRLFERARSWLCEGGVLALDAYRADEFHEESRPEDLPDDAAQAIAGIDLDGVHYEVLEASNWDRDEQRMDARYIHIAEAAEPEPPQYVISQRYLLLPELESLLVRAGFGPPEIGSLGEDDQVWSAVCTPRQM